MANRMILNETSYFGAGSISEIVTEAKKRAFKKALVVTDPDLIKFNVAKNVTDLLEEAGLAYDIFSQVKANPTVKVVKAGIEAFKAAGADYLIAIGRNAAVSTIVNKRTLVIVSNALVNYRLKICKLVFHIHRASKLYFKPAVIHKLNIRTGGQVNRIYIFKFQVM